MTSTTETTSPPLLREWNYEGNTPVAVVVEQRDQEDHQDQQQRPHGCDNSNTTDAGDDEGPPVALFVRNLATNLRTSFSQLQTEVVAERVEDEGGGEDSGGGGGGIDSCLDVSSAAAARVPPPQEAFLRSSSFEGNSSPSSSTHRALSSTTSEDPTSSSGEEWVVDAFDEAEFHVVDGELVEVSVPVPSIEETEDWDDHLLREKQCGNINTVRKNVRRVRKWMRKRSERRLRCNSSDGGDGSFGCTDRGQNHADLTQGVENVPNTSEQKPTGGSKKKNKKKQRRRAFGRRTPKTKQAFDSENSCFSSFGEVHPPSSHSSSIAVAPALETMGCRSSENDGAAPPQVARLVAEKYEPSLRGRWISSRGGQDGGGCSDSAHDAALAKIARLEEEERKAKAVGDDSCSQEEMKEKPDATASHHSSTSESVKEELEDVKKKENGSKKDDCNDAGESGGVIQALRRSFLHPRKVEIENMVTEALKMPPPVSSTISCSSSTAASSSVGQEVSLDSYQTRLPPPPPSQQNNRPQMKVMFVGAHNVGKSSILSTITSTSHLTDDDHSATSSRRSRRSSITSVTSCSSTTTSSSSTSSHRRTPRTRSNGIVEDVDVQFWQPMGDLSLTDFSLWDFAGSDAHNGVHHATQSLFFSSDSLFVLVWDMGAKSPKTWREPYYEEDEEDEEHDAFAAENANHQSDQALQRELDEKVIFWVDAILRSGVKNCQILPVCTFGDLFEAKWGEEECKRRRMEMVKRIRGHLERIGGEQYLELVKGFEEEAVSVNVMETGGVDSLCDAIVFVGDSRSCKEDPLSDTIVKEVKDVLRRLRGKRHKVVHVDKIVEMLDIVGLSNREVRYRVNEVLEKLSTNGSVIFFGETLTKQSDQTDILSSYVLLDPKWLVSAISCVLRPDLQHHILESRNFLYSHSDSIDNPTPSNCSFLTNSHTNCPVVSSSEVSMLWQSLEVMRKAGNQAAARSGPCTEGLLFEFLREVLVRQGILLPLNYALPDQDALFLVPSLLSSKPPPSIWTYKTRNSWSTTLCDSWLFRGVMPPGFMDKLISHVLTDILQFTYPNSQKEKPSVNLHQFMCWRNAFLLSLITPSSNSLSTVEIFVHLIPGDCRESVASASVPYSSHRLLVSAKGQVGDSGRKIWEGGFDVVTKSVEKCVRGWGDQLGVTRNVICPECLESQHLSDVSYWKMFDVRAAVKEKRNLRCGHCHVVDPILVSGLRGEGGTQQHELTCRETRNPSKSLSLLLPSVVLVGLWDPNEKAIKSVGSGFVADREKGLIITASHVLYDMKSDKSFGKAFYGVKGGKAVIGVIPQEKVESSSSGPKAVFRYFAEVVEKDLHNVDACVLRITTKFATDVGGEGEGCGDQPEILLKSSMKAMKAEKLSPLKLSKRSELDEQVRILGFNQGGEGILKPGTHINTYFDFAHGYVCMKYKSRSFSSDGECYTDTFGGHRRNRKSFNPKEEIVVMCPTIMGHSGGPCVRHDGSVIGILSRADASHGQRCYLVPASELKVLLKKAKSKCSPSPVDLYLM